MDEDAKLNQALERADEVLATSLRREEAQRQRLRQVLALTGVGAICMLVGLVIGAGGMNIWIERVKGHPVAKAAESPPAASSPVMAVSLVDPPTTGPCEVKHGSQW